LDRVIGFGDGEFAKEVISGLSCLCEADVGDFTCRGVELMVVIAMDFVSEDRANFFQGGEFFIDTGPNDPILEPAIGSFDLTFGLGREGEGDIDAQKPHHLSPRGIDVIGLEDVFTPEAISSLDKTKDSEGIDIVAQR